ncbi:hypothetical protein FKP32DRAFT_1605857 [Trametes sanguinea]|nr:hypothetical protein FKP32DRAFT_1605857 [Trametes sanguinea]
MPTSGAAQHAVQSLRGDSEGSTLLDICKGVSMKGMPISAQTTRNNTMKCPVTCPPFPNPWLLGLIPAQFGRKKAPKKRPRGAPSHLQAKYAVVQSAPSHLQAKYAVVQSAPSHLQSKYAVVQSAPSHFTSYIIQYWSQRLTITMSGHKMHRVRTTSVGFYKIIMANTSAPAPNLSAEAAALAGNLPLPEEDKEMEDGFAATSASSLPAMSGYRSDNSDVLSMRATTEAPCLLLLQHTLHLVASLCRSGALSTTKAPLSASRDVSMRLAVDISLDWPLLFTATKKIYYAYADMRPVHGSGGGECKGTALGIWNLGVW